MLNPQEKDELVSRCILMMRDYGVAAGRIGANEVSVMTYDFDEFQIRSRTPEDPRSKNPIYIELMVRQLVKRWKGQIFLADVRESGVQSHYWGSMEDARRALTVLRKIMVLDDLSYV